MAHSHSHGHACEDELLEKNVDIRSNEFNSLYQAIDNDSIRVLNAAAPANAKRLFRPWDQRLDESPDNLIESEDDEELIIFVPFNACVKLKSIVVKGIDSNSAPSSIQLFINRDDVDFSNVRDIASTQTIELSPDLLAEIEYPTKITKCQNVRCVTFFIAGNFGDVDQTQLSFFGLRGETTGVISRQAVECSYESAAQLSDHKQATENKQFSKLGQ